MWTQWALGVVCVGLGLLLQTALHDQHPHPGQTMCDARKLGLIVLGGDGSLGRDLLHALDSLDVARADFCGASVHIAAVGGSRGYIKHSHGLSWDHLRSLLNHTTIGGAPSSDSHSPIEDDATDSEHVEAADTDDDGLQHRKTLRDVLGDLTAFGHYDKFIVVDCTTISTTSHVDDLVLAKSLGMGLALANIHAVAGSWKSYQSLVLDSSKAKQSSLVAVDATVGRGLPVLSTLRRLQASGDHVTLVRGTFSDAVGHILAEMEAGNTFSDALTTVYENGLTEDDPRDDLSGVVLARKAVVIARQLGKRMEVKDVVIDGLLPRNLINGTVAAFFHAVGDLNDEFKAKWVDASDRGHKLAFVASINDGEVVRIGLQSVDKTHILHAAHYGDSVVEIHTRHFPHGILSQVAKPDATGTVAAIVADIASLSCALFRRCSQP